LTPFSNADDTTHKTHLLRYEKPNQWNSGAYVINTILRKLVRLTTSTPGQQVRTRNSP